ncbi:hypothetical protein SMIM3I_02229 [Streptococcus mitis]|uniref:Uncharacterized protein n=1 Tax=Streptococcus mitis TaxID=28037 RepID=A0A150NX01_STRMT|nr:hypothetical protein SMIM3I_02229 [Streptococcus mitis]
MKENSPCGAVDEKREKTMEKLMENQFMGIVVLINSVSIYFHGK